MANVVATDNKAKTTFQPKIFRKGARTAGSAKMRRKFSRPIQTRHPGPNGAPVIDFAANARSLGAGAENVKSVAELGEAMQRARASDTSYLISIRIDGPQSTPEGGC